jgi:hypothetical protein
MSWTPTKLNVSKITAAMDPKTKVLALTIQGAGFSNMAEVILVHVGATVVELVPAMKSTRGDNARKGILRGNSVIPVGTTALKCSVNSKNALAGQYRVVVAEVSGDALQVALSTKSVKLK